jgi:hypothetical protein
MDCGMAQRVRRLLGMMALVDIRGRLVLVHASAGRLPAHRHNYFVAADTGEAYLRGCN